MSLPPGNLAAGLIVAALLFSACHRGPSSLAGPAPAAQPTQADQVRSCGWDAQLGASVFQDGATGGVSAAEVKSRLLEPEAAREQTSALAREAVESACSGRYEQLAALVGPKGLCLRGMKGGSCVQLSADEVARCGVEPQRSKWSLDLGTDEPEEFMKTCAQAMREVFCARDFAHPSSVNYNCFPPMGRGNNPAPVIARPARAFVEFHVVDPKNEDAWQSLWVVFDTRDEARDADGRAPLELVELQAERWGI